LQQVRGQWIGGLEGTPEFASILSGIPNNILDARDKLYLDPLQYHRLQNVQYRFPWRFGTNMQYGILGVHESGFAVAVNGWKAVDLLSDGDTTAGHAPNRLLASAGGTISYKCTPNPGEFTTAIRIGDIMYTHLLDNGGLYVGRFFSQGEEMGQMKTGTFYEKCGYANQGGNWFHVHLGFPNTGSFTAGNWSLNLSDQIWRQDGETRDILSWLQAGGVEFACPHSGGVILYKHANYDCGGEASEDGHFIGENVGVKNIPSSFNDQASSLRVPSGWSVRLFEHADREGGRVCFSDGDLDLSGNLFDNSVPVNDNISSMEIFSEEICPPLYGPLLIESFSVDDDMTDESNGNGDAVVSPGETIELNIMLHNQGIETASNVESTLRTDDPFVSLLENTVSTFQDIPAGDSGQNTQDWELLIDPEAPAGHMASICLDPITAGDEGLWTACFELEITIPKSCDAYEPNNVTSLSTPISYGDVVNWSAICPAGDEDYFAFSGTAGDKVFADIDGQIYASALDSHLALIDSNGTTILVQNEDEPGFSNSTDSQISFQLPHDGTYFLRVRASNHPGDGGLDHYYSISLTTDDAAPTVAITDPENGAWLDPRTVTITAAASDDASGVQELEFWWHENGQINPYWTLLGEDNNSVDGWQLDFDTSVQPEQQSGALRVRATDRLGNFNEDTSSNLGLDRTAPSSVANSPAVIDWLIVPISWTAEDNLSGVDNVTLWVRYPGKDWRDTGLPAQSGASGTFDAMLAFGSGSYEFATRAVDYAGNDEGKPLAADTSFYYEVPYSAYFSIFAKN
jgi:hypothetical protein